MRYKNVNGTRIYNNGVNKEGYIIDETALEDDMYNLLFIKAQKFKILCFHTYLLFLKLILEFQLSYY